MLRCYRCNYDLSALVLSKPAADARSRCSERGLEFGWADMLDPARQDVIGYLERAPNGKVVVSACRTLLWSV